MWVCHLWYAWHLSFKQQPQSWKISQVQKWPYWPKTRNTKWLISVHLCNLCGGILLPKDTAQWHAEVRGAVKLHSQELSSVPRYRVLQRHWGSFPKEEKQLPYLLTSQARNYTSQFISYLYLLIYQHRWQAYWNCLSFFSSRERYNKPEVQQWLKFTLHHLGCHSAFLMFKSWFREPEIQRSPRRTSFANKRLNDCFP